MRRAPVPHASDENYLASVSDLIVGLLFVFIIMLMAFAIDFRRAESAADITLGLLTEERDQVGAQLSDIVEEREDLAIERDGLKIQRDQLREISRALSVRDQIRHELLREIERRLTAFGIDAVIDAEKGIIRLPERLLFASGEAALSRRGRRALAVLADILGDLLPCYTQDRRGIQITCPANAKPILEAVLVEGHTDDRPISSPEFADNWELSVARSVGTYRELIHRRADLDELRNGRDEILLGVSGYAARRPVVADQADQDDHSRRLNRRIDLRFLVAALSVQDLKAINAELK